MFILHLTDPTVILVWKSEGVVQRISRRSDATRSNSNRSISEINGREDPERFFPIPKSSSRWLLEGILPKLVPIHHLCTKQKSSR